MKHIVFTLSILVASGCMKPQESPKPTSQPAITATQPLPANTDSKATPASPSANAPAANHADPKQGFDTQPANLMDLAEALKNPKIVIVTGKITGADPLTASAQAYFSVPAKAQIANFQNQVRITKAIYDDKPLTHSQLMELIRQLRIEFLPLPPWQFLGYDSKTGDMVVLEDKAEKIRRFKERDIPIEDADKQYDTP